MAKQHSAGKLIVLAIVAVVATLAFGSVVFAQTPPAADQRPGHAGRLGPGARPLQQFLAPFAGLQLTEEQRQQMRAIVQKHQPEIKAAVEKLQAARKARRAAATAQPVDQAALDAANSQFTAAQTDMMTLRRGVQNELIPVLTPEQKQQLQQRRASRHLKREPGL